MQNNLVPFPEPQPGFRLVPARFGQTNDKSVIAWIECPDWCTVDHVDEPEVHLEDVMHHSDDYMWTACSFAQMGPVQALRSSIQLDPLSDDPRMKAAHIVITDEGEDAYLTPDMVEQVADDAVRWAAQLRQQARTVRAFNGGSDPDMDEALRRVRQGGAR